MATVGKIVAVLTANIKPFSRDMKRAQRTISDVSAKVVRFGAIMAAAAAAGIAVMVRAQLKLIDTLGKTADKLGMTIAGLQGLRLAGEKAGVAANTLDMGLQRMTRRIAEAAVGTGEAQGALKELGLSATSLAKLRPEEQFKRLADAMELVEDQGHRVRLGMKLFDSEGVALINVLRGGSAALEASEKKLAALGATMTRLDVAKVEEVNDRWTDFRATVSGIAQKLTVKLAPVLFRVAEILEKMVAFIGRNIGAIARAVVAIGAVTIAIKAVRRAQQAVVVGQVLLMSLAGPAAWAQMAAGILVASATLGGISIAFDKIGRSASAAFTEIGQATDGMSLDLIEAQGRVRALQEQLKEERFRILGSAESLPIIAQLRAAQKLVEELEAHSRLAFVPAQQLSGVEQAIDKLREEADALENVTTATRLSTAAFAGATAEQLAYAASILKAIDIATTAAGVAKLTESLQRQIATFGMSGTQIAIWTLQQQGATDAVLGHVRALQEQLKELSRGAELDALADRIREATLTPMEQFEKKIKQLRELLSKGKITETVFERALKAAEDALKAMTETAVTKVAEVVQEKRTGEGQQGNLRRMFFKAGATRGQKVLEETNKRQEGLLKRIADRLDDPPPTKFSFG